MDELGVGLPKIKETAEAVEAVLKAVPVYPDLVQPTAREIGTVMGRAVHAALMPLRGVVWCFEQIEDFVTAAVTERLADVPPERVQTPAPTVAGPALEALRFAGSDETLRELYANLLATAMDRQSAERAHPAFVEIIKQLTPDEAKILRMIARSGRTPRPVINISGREKDQSGRRAYLHHFSLIGEQAGCQHVHLTPSYLENLCRLMVTAIPPYSWYSDPGVYDAVEGHAQVLALKARIAADGRTVDIERERFDVTNFGAQFLAACVAWRRVGE
jgi:Abortive infection alpha